MDRLLGADPAPAGSTAAYTPPFTLTSSTNLSEDYYLTNQVLMGADDRVLPFQRPDGTVEAFVFNGSTLMYLRRDTSAASGWSYDQIGFPQDFGPVYLIDVAVSLGSNGTVYAVFTHQDTYQDGYTVVVEWMTLAPGASTWNVLDGGDFEMPEEYDITLGPLQTGIDKSGQVNFYCVNSDGSVLLWMPQAALGANAIAITGLIPATYTDTRLLWNAGYQGGGAASAQGALFAVTEIGTVWYRQTGPTSLGPVQDFNSLARTLWMGWGDPNLGQVVGPAYAAQLTSGYVVYSDGISGEWAVDQFPAQIDGVAVWTQGDLNTFAVLVADTLSIVSQFSSDPNSIGFTQGIPIAQDLVAVTGCPTDPHQGTVFVVDSALTLRVLTKDPTSGVWTDTPVHQKTCTTQALNTWRVQVELTDSNGFPLTNTSVSITPDRAVGIWQPSGASVADPSTPFVTTTDGFGKVTLALPATDLDAPMLSVQILQDSTSVGAPLSVNPAQTVHDFLAGKGSLDGVGALSPTDGSALLAAQNPDGTPLFPVLHGISDPTAKAKAAAGMAAAVGQCMTAATAPQPAPGATASFVLDMTTSTPTYTSSTSASILPAQSVGGVSSWWHSAERDAESAFHAVRHGVVKVEHCAATWAKSAKNWAVNLAITVYDDISDVISYAISDIRTAIHAVSSFFRTLGADIKNAIAWLKTNIRETFASAAANSNTLNAWMKQLGTSIDGDLTAVGKLINGWFVAQTDKVNQEFTDTMLPGTQGLTLGEFENDQLTGVQSGIADLSEIWHDGPAGWLLDKIESEFASELQTPGNSDPLATAMNDLIAVVVSTQWLTDIGDTLWKDFKVDSTKDVSSIKEMTVVLLLQIAQALVDEVLDFADTVVTKVLAVLQAMFDSWVDMLETNLLNLPLISEILNLFGVELNVSVGDIFGMILMFPTTIAYRIGFGGDGKMFQSGVSAAARAGVGAASDPLGADLTFAHAVVRGFGALVDAIVDAKVYDDSGSDAATRRSPLKYVGYLDTVFNTALVVLTYPGKKNADGTTAPPFVNPIIDFNNNTVHDRITYSKYIIGVVNPALTAVAQYAKANSLAAGYTTWAPYIRTVLGVSGFALGVAGSLTKTPVANDKVIVAGALEAVPGMVAPLAVQAINDGAFDIPLAIKLATDAILEPIAAALISYS